MEETAGVTTRYAYIAIRLLEDHRLNVSSAVSFALDAVLADLIILATHLQVVLCCSPDVPHHTLSDVFDKLIMSIEPPHR